MKRILLSTALGLAFIGTAALTGSAAFAQQAPPTLPENAPNAAAPAHHRHHAPDPQHQAEFLSKKLNLSADQTAKLTPIFAGRDQKFQSLMQDQSLTPQQRHEQMKAIHQSTEQQLATVLTPDQLQQLKTMHHGHRRSGPNGPNGDNNQAPPPPAPSGL
jgi:Spy/CpxP family protein refolding chaperone